MVKIYFINTELCMELSMVMSTVIGLEISLVKVQ